MSLLEQAPRFDLADAARFARDIYGIDAAASALPSERDQNVLLATCAGDRYVLKIANASEDRTMLEAQNAAMTHVADRVALSPRVLATIDGDTIATAPGGLHLVRLVTYVAGIPLAKAGARTPALHESLGRAVGRLDAALADFDHPAIHRYFHWDLAHAADIIGEHLPLVGEDSVRDLVERVSGPALHDIASREAAFRRTAVHHDANDWNVLVSTPESQLPNPNPNPNPNPQSQIPNPLAVAIIDFGDMVHSWTVADPAVAVAYAMLDAPNPLATAAAIVRGYQAAHPLRDDELAAVFPLACLRLCMSACIAAWQQRQRPDDAYLGVSQAPIRRTLPVLAAIPIRVAEETLRSALCDTIATDDEH
jgi:Ser/Thr protein kinase RdoA (MazF antagonist)